MERSKRPMKNSYRVKVVSLNIAALHYLVSRGVCIELLLTV